MNGDGDYMTEVVCNTCLRREEFLHQTDAMEWLASHECDGLKLAQCPACDTATRKDTVEAAIGVVEDHNEMRHDGEQVAGLGPNAIQVPQLDEDVRGALERTLVAAGDIEVEEGEAE